jgi:hypothetical protein
MDHAGKRSRRTRSKSLATSSLLLALPLLVGLGMLVAEEPTAVRADRLVAK